MTNKAYNPYSPRIVVGRLDCDTKRLYSGLDIAIAYLQEMKLLFPDVTLQLEEEWPSYECMEMTFTTTRMETKTEAKVRGDEETHMAREAEGRRAKASRQRSKLAALSLAYKRDMKNIIDEGDS